MAEEGKEVGRVVKGKTEQDASLLLGCLLLSLAVFLSGPRTARTVSSTGEATLEAPCYSEPGSFGTQGMGDLGSEDSLTRAFCDCLMHLQALHSWLAKDVVIEGPSGGQALRRSKVHCPVWISCQLHWLSGD